jgi:hypothetical protein
MKAFLRKGVLDIGIGRLGGSKLTLCIDARVF